MYVCIYICIHTYIYIYIYICQLRFVYSNIHIYLCIRQIPQKIVNSVVTEPPPWAPSASNSSLRVRDGAADFSEITTEPAGATMCL